MKKEEKQRSWEEESYTTTLSKGFWLGYHSHGSYKLHPEMCDSSECFVTSQTFGIVSLFNFSCTDLCIVESHCNFNLCFLDK